MEALDILDKAKLPELLSLFNFEVIGKVSENTDHVFVKSSIFDKEYFVFIDEKSNYFIIDKYSLQKYTVKDFACFLFCINPKIDLHKLEKIEPLLALFNLKVATDELLAEAFVLNLDSHNSTFPFLNHSSLDGKVFNKNGLSLPIFNKGQLTNLVTQIEEDYQYYNLNTDGVWNNTVSSPEFAFFCANPNHIFKLYQNFIPDNYLCVLFHEKVSNHTTNRILKHSLEQNLTFVLAMPQTHRDASFLLHFAIQLLSYNVGDSFFSVVNGQAHVTSPIAKDFIQIMSDISDVNYSLRSDLLGDEPDKFPDHMSQYFSIDLISSEENTESLEFTFSLYPIHIIRFIELLNLIYPIQINLTDFLSPINSSKEPTIISKVATIEKVNKVKPPEEIKETVEPINEVIANETVLEEESEYELSFDDDDQEEEDNEPDFDENDY